jgi:hypothetical protein
MFKIQGWVEKGNTVIQTSGLPSSNKAQGSFPSALVTVIIHGTATLATLYSDDNLSPTPLANPFTSNSDGSFGFYAVSGRYDITFSGGTLTAPFTLSDVTNGAGGGSGNVIGPLSAVNNDVAVFDGVTGSLIKDSGQTIAQIIALAGVTLPSVNDGRLTLASGFPVFAPVPATPSSTNTGTEIVTFATDPGWPTGTIVTPASTLAGLTAGTRYYFGRLSSLTGAFYTSLANANANTSKVDLTASVTQQIIPSGITQTSIIFTPYKGDKLSLFDGVSTWTTISFIETSLALGTLTSGLPYDVFAFNNSGTMALELLAWSSATVRATAIVKQNGVWVKSGATTRRLLGSIYTDSTLTTIDDAGGIASAVGAQRYVSNLENRVSAPVYVWMSGSWNYSSATVEQANATAGAKVSLMDTIGDAKIDLSLLVRLNNTIIANGGSAGFGTDSVTVFDNFHGSVCNPVSNAANNPATGSANYRNRLLGKHDINWLENGTGSGVSTWWGQNALTAGNAIQDGIVGDFLC